MIRQNEINVVGKHVSKELISFAFQQTEFATFPTQGFAGKRGDTNLWHAVEDADGEVKAVAKALLSQNLHEFITEPKNLVCVVECHTPSFRQNERTVSSLEQGFSKDFLELPELGAEGGLAQAQLFCSLRDAPLHGNGSKIKEMVIV
jgi:hypothetical protein